MQDSDGNTVKAGHGYSDAKAIGPDDDCISDEDDDGVYRGGRECGSYNDPLVYAVFAGQIYMNCRPRSVGLTPSTPTASPLLCT